jgi:hypothetical protein
MLFPIGFRNPWVLKLIRQSPKRIRLFSKVSDRRIFNQGTFCLYNISRLKNDIIFPDYSMPLHCFNTPSRAQFCGHHRIDRHRTHQRQAHILLRPAWDALRKPAEAVVAFHCVSGKNRSAAFKGEKWEPGLELELL